jgi:hypothetical protein
MAVRISQNRRQNKEDQPNQEYTNEHAIFPERQLRQAELSRGILQRS